MKIKTEALFYRKLDQRITELRKKAGFSNQGSFAHEVGIARGQYTRYETGTNMKVNNLMEIINYHGLTSQEFFGEV